MDYFKPGTYVAQCRSEYGCNKNSGHDGCKIAHWWIFLGPCGALKSMWVSQLMLSGFVASDLPYLYETVLISTAMCRLSNQLLSIITFQVSADHACPYSDLNLFLLISCLNFRCDKHLRGPAVALLALATGVISDTVESWSELEVLAVVRTIPTEKKSV